MIEKHAASAVALAFFALLALGSGSSGDKSGSSTTTAAQTANTTGALGNCTEADKTTCKEWHAWVLDEQAAKGECTGGVLGAGRTWSSGGCPSNATLLGTCAVTEEKAKLTRFFYKAPGRTSASEKQSCEAGGDKWTDGPGADAPAPKAAAPAAAPAKAGKPQAAKAKGSK